MGDRFVVTLFIDAAIGVDEVRYIAPPRAETWRLLAMSVMPIVTSAANATNYVTLAVYQDTGTSTAIATALTTATVALTEGTVRNFTLTGSQSQLEITQTEPLHYVDDQSTGGAGIASSYTLSCEFERIRT